ncbi:MAG: hypothetical protein M0T70_02845 [Geobacteraceae bacterium]|nr:hypothetical protein [Geobacteraceae bacterium]
MPRSLIDSFRLVILANELENNPNAAYRFSDPDGVLTGKSGWSYGISQLDINNNPSAILGLRDCAFTTDQIAALKAQTVRDMAPMNAKLKAAAEIIDAWDKKQLQECLTQPSAICSDSGIRFSDAGLISMADYHNQMYMSRGGKLHKHLAALKQVVTAEIIRDFKLSLPWGQKRPDDVKRRYNNIVKVMRG